MKHSGELHHEGLHQATSEAERLLAKLLSALQDEQAALIEGNSDALVEASHRKEQHAVVLADLLRDQGESQSSLLARIAGPLGQASEMHRLNEKLLAMRMRAVRQALTALARDSGQGYGADGQLAVKGRQGLSVQA